MGPKGYVFFYAKEHSCIKEAWSCVGSMSVQMANAMLLGTVGSGVGG